MEQDPKTIPQDKDDEAVQSSEGQSVECNCIQDPFAVLPPELKPRQKPEMGSLRKATCPICGFQYWTNRKTDLCVECEKKGLKLPLPESKSEGG